MSYAKQIKNLRKDYEPKLYQKDVAKILGITQQTYSQYESGIRKMPIEHLIKLCEFYGVSADYILGLPKGLKYPER